ncbi:eukaryotic translation initiation factor 3 subunit D-like [Musa acuminata AAA Group]|uniref:eukaryotic translation initiation factor 3 subunit D-like n=1 Tax=Musa acuminata AAA Group TaxID=214697 RepID=UPI0031E2F9D5
MIASVRRFLTVGSKSQPSKTDEGSPTRNRPETLQKASPPRRSRRRLCLKPCRGGSEAAMGFDVGVVPFNLDGWGPPKSPAAPLLLSRNDGESTQPANIPFAPFSRSEKLGRVADWTRNPNFGNNAARSAGGRDAVFDFALDESSALSGAAADDSSFRLVDGKPPPRPKFGPRWRFQQRPQLPQRRDEEVEARKREAEKERARRDRLYRLHHRSYASAGGHGAAGSHRDAPARKSSVDIQPEWTMLDQIPFSTFSKLSFSVPDPPEDLLVCGALEFYDRSFDRVNPKNERRLERFKSRNFFKVTTSDDPVIRRLAADDKATVFATDAILSALMCAPRSVYSWDIVIQRVGNKLFFDKRDRSQLDLLSVHETSQELLPDAKEDINSAYSLAVEATYINQNFSQQVLVRDGNKVTFDEPNPFASEGEEVASVAYRYRRWKLDEDTHIIARCEVHSVTDVKGQRAFMTLNALNEFDPKFSGVDWRQKLETQRGAVLATELKNNANKLAKWTAQALLGGADLMKLGYVSRVHPRDHFNHVILSVIGYKPKDFATQINLNTSNMWGIVKSIVDLCMKLNEGKYVLVKDPVKPQVRIYEVPADAFENEYVEEPLPEEEQVQPPAEEDATVGATDAAAEAEPNTAAGAAEGERDAIASAV